MKAEYKALGSFGTLGLEIALCIVFGALGGQWIDGKLGTSPGFIIFGFVCGLGAAGKAVVRVMREMQEVTAKEEREQGNPAPQFEPPDERNGSSRGPRGKKEGGGDERA
jgi:F0F1-type ATP synthase assembly protein I